MSAKIPKTQDFLERAMPAKEIVRSLLIVPSMECGNKKKSETQPQKGTSV